MGAIAKVVAATLHTKLSMLELNRFQFIQMLILTHFT